MTKREHIEAAALRLRVMARRSEKRVTQDMAWDAIAEWQGQNYDGPALAATDVLRVARKALKANDEAHLA